MQEFEEPIPEWAVRRSEKDEYCFGTQLCTKDGRRCGNAMIIAISSNVRPSTKQLYAVYHIVTDAGNFARLTLEELKSSFHPPQWIASRVMDHLDYEVGNYLAVNSL